MLRRSAAGTLTCLLGAMALAACTPADPPASTPTPTAIFASEDEALAAATDVYQQYNAAFDEALSKGGADMTGLRSLATDEHFTELDKPGTIDENGWHTEGASSFEVKSVAWYRPDSGQPQIALNVCRNLASVRVVDSRGIDVTPQDWPEAVPLVVSFVPANGDSPSLVVSKVDSWLEPDPC